LTNFYTEKLTWLRIFETMVLSRIFWFKRDEETGGGACSAYGGEEKRIQGFGGEMRERDHLGDPDVDGKIILRWIFRKWRY